MLVMRSSTFKMSYLRQQERSWRHQNLVTQSYQDQIRILRITQKTFLSEVVKQLVLMWNSVLKGAIKASNHHVGSRPYSQASSTCQTEGPHWVKGGNWQRTGLLDRRGNHHRAGWTNTMGLFIDNPHEAKWRSEGLSGSKQLEQGHHQRAP